ncbi:hypothetical protein NIES4072_10080 [Nostoc commune NIES-4072]|uniref:Uncharacterized protein n=1 Tax=Nostoc commune NIES-4072 TaxID=2005467 RepID=A0A2R5FFM3_NOSCO|nr:hypothetical protein NIES4070_16750 [Nostoc commune HK-02]GBG17352.1 hypothetical protein NIES4072_10080 [Nostoc commune NIES-4072]
MPEFMELLFRINLNISIFSNSILKNMNNSRLLIRNLLSRIKEMKIEKSKTDKFYTLYFMIFP